MSFIQKSIRDELNTKEPFTNMNKDNYVRWILMLLENSSLICKKKILRKFKCQEIGEASKYQVVVDGSFVLVLDLCYKG